MHFDFANAVANVAYGFFQFDGITVTGPVGYTQAFAGILKSPLGTTTLPNGDPAAPVGFPSGTSLGHGQTTANQGSGSATAHLVFTWDGAAPDQAPDDSTPR